MRVYFIFHLQELMATPSEVFSPRNYFTETRVTVHIHNGLMAPFVGERFPLYLTNYWDVHTTQGRSTYIWSRGPMILYIFKHL